MNTYRFLLGFLAVLIIDSTVYSQPLDTTVFNNSRNFSSRKDCEANEFTSLEMERGYTKLKNFVVNLITCDGRAMMWLQEAPLDDPAQPESSPPKRILYDFLSIGALKPGQALTISPVCTVGKDRNPIVWFGVFEITKKYPYTWKNGKLVVAWTVNAETKRFELAPPALLHKAVCVSESDED